MKTDRVVPALLSTLAVSLVLGASASGGGRPPASAAPDALPATPVGKQVAWVTAQVNGDAASLTESGVRAHFAPSFLAGLPASVVVQVMKETATGYGPLKLQGLAGHPTRTGAIALVESRKGDKLAIYASVEPRAPHRFTALEITERPDPGARAIASPGPYTGAFPVGGGRKLFLNCSGTGSPTVLLEAGGGGGSASWRKVQRPLSKQTRVCSYDRANVPGGSSDPAAKPQTATDIIRDLHRALGAARVPKPYVLAGHSNGGLYARLFASNYPAEVNGLVLVDSISEQHPARERALLKKLMTARQWRMWLREQGSRPPFIPYVGDEQVDIPASYKQMAAAARTNPLKPMALIVISHGKPDPMDEHGVKGLRRGVEQMWQAMQADLAKLSPDGQRIVARNSHHQIPSEQPGIIVDVLEEIVATVR